MRQVIHKAPVVSKASGVVAVPVQSQTDSTVTFTVNALANIDGIILVSGIANIMHKGAAGDTKTPVSLGKKIGAVEGAARVLSGGHDAGRKREE